MIKLALKLLEFSKANPFYLGSLEIPDDHYI